MVDRFDDVLNEVEQFNDETRMLTEMARLEAATSNSAPMVHPIETEGFRYNTGDSDLDGLLNGAQQGMAEFRVLADQARTGLGPGQYLSIDDAIEHGGSQGLSDFLQQRLDWIDHATPEQLRQFEHQVDWSHEVEMARAHEHDVLNEQSELMERFIKHQTEDHFNAEKAGYHQVNPWGPYQGYSGDPNIFEKNGEYFRLIPGTGGHMDYIGKVP